MSDQIELDRAADANFKFAVNGVVYGIDDPEPQGRQLLTITGFLPPDEHILIQQLDHRTQSIGLDETVNLRPGGGERFRAFHGDRIFQFTIDGRGYEWGAGEISEPDLRDIANLGDSKVIVQERDNGDVIELGDDDILNLRPHGTEHLKTRKGDVEVFYDGDVRTIPRGVYTTEELMQIFGVDAGHLLNVVNSDNLLVALQPGEKTRIRKGMKFVSQVPCGGSS